MRVLPVVLVCLVPALGCGDTESPTAPTTVRSCGELDDVDPQEPMATGEDEFGCPVFQPVPCTQPVAEYDSVCGPDCWTATAAGSDGDAWFIGCVAKEPRPVGCLDLEVDLPPSCFVEPNAGEALWFFSSECGAFDAVVALQQCWEPCNAVTADVVRDLCP